MVVLVHTFIVSLQLNLNKCTLFRTNFPLKTGTIYSGTCYRHDISIEVWSVNRRRRIDVITWSLALASTEWITPKIHVPAAVPLCSAWSLCLTRTLDDFNEFLGY